MRLALVINRSAGGFRRFPPAATVAAIRDAFIENGHQVELRMIGRHDLPACFAALSCRNDLDAVVVGGGDGTILSAVSNGVGYHLPLGILPLGTLNLFARDVGLPLDPILAAHAIAHAGTARIDLAEVDGRPFAIWASFGMHPWIVRRRDHLQRRHLRKMTAMALAALRGFFRFPQVDVTLTLDQTETRTVRTPMLFISNNTWRDEPPPLSRQTLDTGRLEIHIATCSGRLSLLWLALETMMGHWRTSRHLQTFSASEVLIASPQRRLMVSLDGEVAVMSTPLLFRVRHRVLKVLIPGREVKE
ncbi:lipid kinase MamU [Magnetospirillum molischianum]|uniref:Sphingosine kinase and enzyme related to eukaryotic diacylglycerol kinase n=1 Tax=Magnetospirillum molischianum DSM 120 TaxID=1150626 RepID=H8FRB7_MAGML|nr:lipid kinase MamU [Magnetospirillum molischianum]CCG40905.1 Sphingosine kinase and enzyme related to eukaryotic diacylglycerol kinase [Magnetospirillum molischianum DSM 120]